MMKIVIIEDEKYTADYLSELITDIDPSIQVNAVLHSVKDAIFYLANNEAPELLFCDIHLTDGNSFEIFQQVPVNIPVIFVTAFDQYALQAFKVNGIDYILKPFNREVIADTIHKFKMLLKSVINPRIDYEAILKEVMDYEKNKCQSSILLKFSDKIKPIKLSDIGIFYTVNRENYLVTLDNEKYLYNRPLEETEKICGNHFYRVSRQALLNRAAIREIRQTRSRKLTVLTTVEDISSLELNKAKISHFLAWLSK